MGTNDKICRKCGGSFSKARCGHCAREYYKNRVLDTTTTHTCNKCGLLYTGPTCKPCKSNYSSNFNAKTVTVLVKKCTKCLIEKESSKFTKNLQHKDGLSSQCLTCIAECSKAWYEKNREASLGKKAEYHALNKDKIKIRKIAYYKSNPDKLIRQSEMSRTYRKRNPVTAKASAKRYYLTNLNKIKEYGKAWTALNRDKKRVYKNNRRCREQSGRLSSDIVRRLLELQEGKCVSCKLPLGVNYHIDHIIPLVRGGLNIDSNVQLLHSTCNLQKGGKDPILYMQELGYLL